MPAAMEDGSSLRVYAVTHGLAFFIGGENVAPAFMSLKLFIMITAEIICDQSLRGYNQHHLETPIGTTTRSAPL